MHYLLFPLPLPPHFLSGYIFQLNFIMSHSLATPARAGDADKPATSCDFDFNDWIYRSLEIIAASSRAGGGGRKGECVQEREGEQLLAAAVLFTKRQAMPAGYTKSEIASGRSRRSRRGRWRSRRIAASLLQGN